MRRVLVLNGSVRGAHGDVAGALLRACAGAHAHSFDRVDLASYDGSVQEMVERVQRADAFLLGTGTYWGSWGSPLQRFLEVMTPLECSDAFLGKPAAAIVTMDSVGGSDVGARLLGAFVSLGCAAPPFSLVVLSRVGAAVKGQAGFEDVWQTEDLEVLMHNLLAAAAAPRSSTRRWSVARGTLVIGPWPHGGTLDLGLPEFLSTSRTSTSE